MRPLSKSKCVPIFAFADFNLSCSTYWLLRPQIQSLTTNSSLSIVKNVKEALVKLLLPQDTFGSNADDDKALIWSRVNVQELAFLLLEVRLARALRILLSLVQLIGNSHVHLDLDSGQVHLIVLIAAHQILVAIMPEQRVGLHLDQLMLRRGSIAISIVLVPIEMVQLHRDDRARLWVLNLKRALQDADLQPVIPVKLTDQVARLVTQGELLAVTREHNLGDVNAKELPFLSLAQTVKEDVVDSTLSTADDSFASILIEEAWLVLHIDLFLQLEVVLAEDENLSLESHVDICATANG